MALLTASLITPANAANLVVNGSFENTLTNTSSEFSDVYGTGHVIGWTSTGFNMLFLSGDADTNGAPSRFSASEGNFKLWGPGTGSNNGLTASSPDGGNFVALEADRTRVFDGPIFQTINNLIPGQAATLTFYWAAAQQYTFNLATTERLDVSLGGTTYSTVTLNNPEHGFVPWQQETFTFLPASTSEVLKFFADGTPAAQPPFVLLDGISLTQTTTPEPATWAAMLSGLAVLGGAARRRRRSTSRPAHAERL